MAEYIEREAMVKASCERCIGGYVSCKKERCILMEVIHSIPAADVRPVVLCGVCELHGHCYTEDVFAFARLAEENRFCAVGKAKTNGGKREE